MNARSSLSSAIIYIEYVSMWSHLLRNNRTYRLKDGDITDVFAGVVQIVAGICEVQNSGEFFHCQVSTFSRGTRVIGRNCTESGWPD